MTRAVRVLITYMAIFMAVFMVVAVLATSALQSVRAGTPAALVQAPGESGYVVRDNSGLLAVYDGGAEGGLMMETAIEVAGLRAVDREKLADGIRAQTYEDVLKLIEDFGS